MYNKQMLSLEQTEKAMQAMIAKATQEPDRPVAIAIVDDAGNLLSYAGLVVSQQQNERLVMELIHLGIDRPSQLRGDKSVLLLGLV